MADEIVDVGPTAHVQLGGNPIQGHSGFCAQTQTRTVFSGSPLRRFAIRRRANGGVAIVPPHGGLSPRSAPGAGHIYGRPAFVAKVSDPFTSILPTQLYSVNRKYMIFHATIG